MHADLMTVAEVADAFGVDERTVRRWIGDGSFTAVRPSRGTLRLLRSEVEKCLAGHPAKGSPCETTLGAAAP